MVRRAKVILLKKMPQKRKLSLWKHSQLQSSRSSEDERVDRSWGDKGLEDVSQKFHHAGWLIKENKESWHKSLKESLKREDELVTLTAEVKESYD